VCLGMMSYGTHESRPWALDEKAAEPIVRRAVEGGINFYDTADLYSQGESEALIGRWLKRDPARRARVVIATKVGFLDGQMVDGEYVAALDPDIVARACDASLDRLGIDTIDLYYQHRDSEAVPLADSLGAFELLREQGKIRATGLSNFAAERVDEAVSVARTCGYLPPVALQPMYSLVERQAFEGELRDAAIRNGLGVFPYFSLANGFLTGKYRSRDDVSKSVRGGRTMKYLDGNGPRVLAALDEVAAETGAALATIALAWLMAQPAITAPIASATSVDQLKELTAAMHLTLSSDQLARLDAASAEAVPA